MMVGLDDDAVVISRPVMVHVGERVSLTGKAGWWRFTPRARLEERRK
jgi:hypothetical protein